MSELGTLSLFDIARKLPVLAKGSVGRMRGLSLVARQKNDTPSGLGLCLEDSAARFPNTQALVYEGRSYTYESFNQWANRLAHYLIHSDTRKGDVVALFIENRPELLVCIAALAKVGAVAALLNTSQRSEVLKHSLELVGAKRILCGAELYDALTDVSDVLPEGLGARVFVEDPEMEAQDNRCPDTWQSFNEISAQGSGENPLTTRSCLAADPFCYFYTSGTTGLPKAAILTHGRFMKAFAGVGLASLQLKHTDRVFITLPFYHGTALAVGWGSILAGHATLVMARQFSARRYWQQVRANGVTAICYVGELCRYLLALPESDLDKKHSVRLMFGNGLRPNIWRAFKKRFAIKRVVEFYGSSEGNVGFLNMFNFDCTVGFTTVPYAIVEYDLVGDEAIRYADGFMRKVRKGETGLLLGEITDKSPFDGYTDAGKTEQTILRNVFKHGDAWFNTGDLMRDQGFRHAQFVDRLGDTFRWKGENVSTTEVENVLSSAKGVIDGVVYGVEIPNTNGRAGMANIRLKEGVALDGVGLYQHLSASLPKYAVPVFLRESLEMETTGTFKYKKTDLKKQAFHPARVEGSLWVCLPGEGYYQRLSDSAYQKILNGQISF